MIGLCELCVSYTSEVAELYLEEHESPLHLSCLLLSLPTVTDLVARLKPKLISDPLIDPSTGTSYSHSHIYRCTYVCTHMHAIESHEKVYTHYACCIEPCMISLW